MVRCKPIALCVMRMTDAVPVPDTALLPIPQMPILGYRGLGVVMGLRCPSDLPGFGGLL